MNPPLALDYKTPQFLTNAIFGEYVNPNCLQALIASGQLQEKFDPNNYSSKLAMANQYENEKDQLSKYLKLFDGNVFKVKYTLPRHGLGRVFPSKALGVTSFPSKTRNTLLKEKYIDLDLSNAQPIILYEVLRANGLENDCPTLEKLIKNRDFYLEEVMTAYSVSRKKAKQLFLRLAFYGTFTGWVLENELDLNFKATSFVNALTSELLRIAVIVKISNMALFEKVRKLNGEKANILGSFMSHYLQTYELHIVSCMCEYLCKETNFCDLEGSDAKILTYEYDGIKLLRDKVVDYGIEQLIKDLENVVLLKTGFHVSLEEKPIEQLYEIEYAPFDRTIVQTFDVLDKDSYKYVKEHFEKTHAKILNKSMFVKQHLNKIIIFKKEALITSYEHLQYKEPVYDKDGVFTTYKLMPFIKSWLKDKDILLYDDMDTYPPPLICPENVFNLWRPFAMDLIEDYTVTPFAEEGFEAIKYHIKVLCNFEDNVYDYFINWLAQMIQFPAIKTVFPTLISDEGAGKGTLIRLIERMLGPSLCFETTDPLRDVFGSFNELMNGSFFVVLNEISRKDTADVLGKLKGLITDNNLTVNVKGMCKFQMQSFHRFIATTNVEDPASTAKGDRRNFIIRSSDIKCGDKEYFVKLNEYLDDTDVVKMFFEYLKKIPDMDKFGTLPMPVTEYQGIIQEESKSPIEMWLHQFTLDNLESDKPVELLGCEACNLFLQWCRKKHLKYECSEIQFGKRLSLLQSCNKISGIEKGQKTNKGNTRLYNIDKLKAHFKITELVDYELKAGMDVDEIDDEEAEVTGKRKREH